MSSGVFLQRIKKEWISFWVLYPPFKMDGYAHVIYFFFACTFAATFRRSAFSRMKPVASSWL